VIRAQDIQFLHASPESEPLAEERLSSLREAERVHIVRVLEEVGWNKKQAAKVLEISRGTLYRKIQEYELKPAQSSVGQASTGPQSAW
jgi:DNA-binding NtrC family response regulator